MSNKVDFISEGELIKSSLPHLIFIEGVDTPPNRTLLFWIQHRCNALNILNPSLFFLFSYEICSEAARKKTNPF